jgi:hypothetical protein|tara:strand:+ start:3775 stop:6720 length:2946 start_codon:yes stop_codon:yes gene_type:complete|mmetsp:Transcript_3902/g.12005  ORF Transcript_3902/g.12005 Transcript_3902/m.12005 type:complete len:982 (+) Transcript_3902:215-3160(+)
MTERKGGGFSVAPKMNARWHVGPAFDPREKEEEEAKRKKRTTSGEDEKGIKSDGLELEEMHAWSDLSKIFKTFAAICFALLVVPTLFGSKPHKKAARKVGRAGVRASRYVAKPFSKKRSYSFPAHEGYDETLDDAYSNPREYDNAIKEYEDAKIAFDKLDEQLGEGSIDELMSEDVRQKYEDALFKKQAAEQKRDFEDSMEKKKKEWTGAMKGASCADKTRHLLESYVEHYSCRFDAKYGSLSPLMNFPVVREDYENAGEREMRALATSTSVADAIKWSAELSSDEKDADMNKTMSTAGLAVSTWLRFYSEKKKEVLGLRDDGTLTWDALTKETRRYQPKETYNEPVPPPPAPRKAGAPQLPNATEAGAPVPPNATEAMYGVDVAVANEAAFDKMDTDGDGSISVDEVTNAALKGEVDLKDGVVQDIVQSKSFKNAALSAEELAMLDAEMKADVAPKKSKFSQFSNFKLGRRKLLRKRNKNDGNGDKDDGNGGNGGNWGEDPKDYKSPFDAEAPLASTAAEYDEAGQLIQQTMEPLYFTVNVFANNFPENIATIAKESATLMRALRLPGVARVFCGNPFKMRDASSIAMGYSERGSGYFSSLKGMVSFATAKLSKNGGNGFVDADLRSECELGNRCGSRWASAPICTDEGETEYLTVPDYAAGGKLPDRVSVPSISYKKALEGGYPLLSIVEDSDKDTFIQAADEALKDHAVPAVLFSNVKTNLWQFIEDLKKRYKGGYNIFAVAPGHEHNPRRPVFLPLDDHALAWSFFKEYYPTEQSVGGIAIALIVRDDVSNLGFNNWLAENKIVACDCNLGTCSAATGVKYEEVKYTIENYKPRKSSWDEATKKHKEKTEEWNNYDRLAQSLKESQTVDIQQQLEADQKALAAKKELEQAEREMKAANAAMNAAKKSAAEKKRSIWNDGWGDFDGFRRRNLLKKKNKKNKGGGGRGGAGAGGAVTFETPPAYCDIDDYIDNEDDVWT